MTAKWNLGHLPLSAEQFYLRVKYGAEVKLEIIYSGEVYCANLTLTSITLPVYDFGLKKI